MLVGTALAIARPPRYCTIEWTPQPCSLLQSYKMYSARFAPVYFPCVGGSRLHSVSLVYQIHHLTCLEIPKRNVLTHHFKDDNHIITTVTAG
ncbi:hypothetical protein IF2G_03025 [Cordyceps javanica]|nr:hypothetical protein IF2G_03025 [Cordyceps javanica]